MEIKVNVIIDFSDRVLSIISSFGKNLNASAACEYSPTEATIPMTIEDPPTEEDTLAEENEPAASKVTLEEIRALAAEKGKTNKAGVKQLLTEFGSENLSKLDKSKYTAFHARLEAM